MSFRKSGKLLTVVGFVICLSCISILYGNLSTVTEERDVLAIDKTREIKMLKAQLENKDTSVFTLENKAVLLEKENQQCRESKNTEQQRNVQLMSELDSLKAKLTDTEARLEESETKHSAEQVDIRSSLEACQGRLQQNTDDTSQLKSRQDELNEASRSCQASVEGLQAELGSKNQRIEGLEEQLRGCGKEPVIEEKNQDGEDVVVQIPVAAVPQLQEKPNIDNNQAIPDAQAAPPQPLQQNKGDQIQPLGAVAPVPVAQAQVQAQQQVVVQPELVVQPPLLDIPAEQFEVVPVQPREEQDDDEQLQQENLKLLQDQQKMIVDQMMDGQQGLVGQPNIVPPVLPAPP